MELDSEIDLTKIMTYLHFYELILLLILATTLQSQYNLFDICFAKQILLMIISNGTFQNIFMYFFIFLLLYKLVQIYIMLVVHVVI